MGEGRMDGGDRPTRADVEAMNQWALLGNSSPGNGAKSDRTHSDGRIVIPSSASEAAREVEESVKAHEEGHAEGHASIILAIGSSLEFSHAVGSGPWAVLGISKPLLKEESGLRGSQDGGDTGSG